MQIDYADVVYLDAIAFELLAHADHPVGGVVLMDLQRETASTPAQRSIAKSFSLGRSVKDIPTLMPNVCDV
jgi:hypothetical protein